MALSMNRLEVVRLARTAMMRDKNKHTEPIRAKIHHLLEEMNKIAEPFDEAIFELTLEINALEAKELFDGLNGGTKRQL